MATAAAILRIAAQQAGWDLEEFDRLMNEGQRATWQQGFDDGYRCAIGYTPPATPCTVHSNPYGEG